MDIDRLTEIYGKSIARVIYDNIDAFTNNIKYLEDKSFENIMDLVGLYPYSFIQEEDEFIEKVDALIDKLGVDYVEKINENYELWGDVDV